MKVEVELGALTGLQRAEKWLRSAAFLAASRSAVHIRDALHLQIATRVDRPVAYTRSSLQAVPALFAGERTSRFDNMLARETPAGAAAVGFRELDKPPRTRHYLSWLETGGPRRAKGVESALRRAGLLPPGRFLVPAAGYPLDAYGNVPRGVVQTILADLRAGSDAYSFSTRETRKRRAKRNRRQSYSRVYTWIPGGRLPMGVYERPTDRGVEPRAVFIAVRQPEYRKILRLRADAVKLAPRLYAAEFRHEFVKRMARDVVDLGRPR